MPTASCGLVLLLIVVLVWLAWVWRRRQHSQQRTASGAATVRRLLKPRTPDDCPVCHLSGTVPTGSAPTGSRVPPWRAVKSRRGAPKRITTQGFACPNRACSYYRIIDEQLHALVAEGTERKAERVQTFRCQACRATCSARRATPMYRLKTVSSRVAEVLSALAEGLDVAAARVFGHQHATITTWLTRAGEHRAILHHRFFQGLHLPHIRLDELRTRLGSRAHILWLWVAVDPLTKIIPVLGSANPGCGARGSA
jgi:hypothetical protein